MSSARGFHPFFDDRGALHWYTTLAHARAATLGSRKIFVVYGRSACPVCKGFVEGVLPDPKVREVLVRDFVCLVIDCNRPDRSLQEIIDHQMRWAKRLPFLLFLDANAGFLRGTQHTLSVEALLEHLAWAAGQPDPAPTG